MAVNTCNPSIGDVKAGGSGIQTHVTNYKVSLGQSVLHENLFQKREEEEKKNKEK